MQKITSEELLEWVDGALSPERSAEISALVAADPDLAKQADFFEASELPYKAAMNAGVPPVPSDLKKQVAQWSKIAEDQTIITSPMNTKSQDKALFYQRSLVATIMMLVVSWGAIWGLTKSPDAIDSWTNAVVGYQQFYVSETVEGITGSVESAELKLQQVKLQYPEFPSIAPNLAAMGYSFKRIQQLDYKNKPLLQMVFYKDGKRPLAICLMPDSNLVESRLATHDVLNSYVWQSGNLRGIVVGEENELELKKIADLVRS